MSETINNEKFKSVIALYTENKEASEQQHGPISSWDTSSVTDMPKLFTLPSSFTEEKTDWNINNITDTRFFPGVREFSVENQMPKTPKPVSEDFINRLTGGDLWFTRYGPKIE